jgi:hypothetical protein
MIKKMITPKSKTSNKRFRTVTFETRKGPSTPYLGLFQFMPQLGHIERRSIKKKPAAAAGFSVPLIRIFKFHLNHGIFFQFFTFFDTLACSVTFAAHINVNA